MNIINYIPNGIVYIDDIPFDFTCFINSHSNTSANGAYLFLRFGSLSRLYDLKLRFMLLKLLQPSSRYYDQNQLRFLRDVVCCERICKGKIEGMFTHLPYPEAIDMAKRNEEIVRKNCNDLLTKQIFFITFVQKYLRSEVDAKTLKSLIESAATEPTAAIQQKKACCIQ